MDKIIIDFKSFTFLQECPKWWENFINTMYDRFEEENLNSLNTTEYRKILQDNLSKYNAHMVFDDYKPVSIVFKSQHDYTFFMLRWN